MMKYVENMRYARVVSLVLLGLFSTDVFQANESFSILTWNVLGVHAPDVESYRYSQSPFSFNYGDSSRLNVTAHLLNTCDADIICLQELADSFLASPESPFGKEFDYTCVSHMKKGSSGVAICCHKAKKMVCLEAGTVPAAFPGACAWAVFGNSNDKNVKSREVLVASVHIGRPNDRSGKDDADNQWQAIVKDLALVMKRYALSSIILAGDLNTFYEEVFKDTKKYLSKLLGVSIDMYSHCCWTANANKHFIFKKTRQDLTGKGDLADFEFASIDHVLYSNDSLVLEKDRSWVGSSANMYKDSLVLSAIQKVNYNDLSHNEKMPLIHNFVPSDHLPVFVTFDFQSVQTMPGHENDKEAQEPAIQNRQEYTKLALELAASL